MATAGASLSDCLIVEVFAGTGRVTACLKQLGLQSSFGVDHVRSRQAAAQIVMCDLSTSQGQDLLWSWLRNPFVVGLFLAPPCGSASRARQIPLGRFNNKRRRKARHGPAPLRTDDHPNGVPGLSETNSKRVSLANVLYHLTSTLVRWACKVGCIVCVENPQYSLFWSTTFWLEVANLVSYSVFHSCQYGSLRKKRTTLAFNAKEFNVISNRCKGQNSRHKHAAWGINTSTNKFATSEETAYPMGLAKIIGHCFILALHRLNIQAPPQTLADIQSTSLETLRRLRATTGVRSRASKLPPIVRLYSHKLQTKVMKSAYKLFQRVREDIKIYEVDIPKGARLISLQTSSSPEAGDLQASEDQGEGNALLQVCGVPWTPLEFIRQAAEAGHPMQLHSCLPPRLTSLIGSFSSLPFLQRLQWRVKKLKFWSSRKIELMQAEKDFHASMHPEVAGVLRNKHLLVWKEMLESISYDDMGVFEEFSSGSTLVGEAQATNLWPRRFSPATMTVSELRRNAELERPNLVCPWNISADPELWQSVWDQTLQEVDDGFLVGPFDLADVPSQCPINLRFGVRQGEKIRCVDDYSKSGVNSCAQVCESPKPHTVDVLCALALSLMSKSGASDPWKIRAFDLKGAYRQCAVHPSSRDFAYIAVPHRKHSHLVVFRMVALPCGSIKSVHSSNTLSRGQSMDCSGYWVGSLLRQVTRLRPFPLVSLLWALTSDVSDMHTGLVRVDNTSARKCDLIETLDSVIGAGRLPQQQALRLRGRMQFSAGQNIWSISP